VVVCGGLESFAVFRRVGDAMFHSEAVNRSSFVVLRPNQHNIPLSTCVKRFGMTEARGAPSRSPGHADHRREGGRGDPERPLDVPASGFKTLTGAQGGGTRQVPGGGASSAVPPGTRAPWAVARVVGQVRAGVE
jgi:hypothetical protein